MFRSQTDEQLAARWDSSPWDLMGARFRGGIPELGYVFAPRVECIPSRDPRPFRDTITWTRYAAQNGAVWPFNWAFAPRPEFARPPVNMFLSSLRRVLSDGAITPQKVVEMYLETLDDHPATRDDVKHARKVLTRLAALS